MFHGRPEYCGYCGVIHARLYVFIHHMIKSPLKKISRLQPKQCDLCTGSGVIDETLYVFVNQH